MRFTIIPPKGKEIIVPKSAKSKMVKGEDLLMFLSSELRIHGYGRYFGLMYCDRRSGEMLFLGRDDTLKRLEIIAGKEITFHIVTNFHPENPEEIFRSSASRRLFCDIMKDKLFSGELGCDIESHAYLDAMYLQAIIGDYTDETIGDRYTDAIRCCDIFTPTYLNCGSSPKESVYIRKVRDYHRNNNGIEQSEAEKLYLSKIKTLPFYPYKLYPNIRTNGHDVCIGLATKGLYLMDDGELQHFKEPNIIAEYQWSDMQSCAKKKHRVHIGVASGSEVDELVFKVKRTEVDRLYKDISILRGGLMTSAGFLQQKPLHQVNSYGGQAAKKIVTFSVPRRVSEFALPVESSFTKLRERTLTGSSASDFFF